MRPGGPAGFMLGLVVVLALAYAGLCALMYVRQQDLIYFPGLTRVAAAETGFELVNEGHTLRGWVVNPGREQAILYFGGNAEAVQHHRDAFAHWFPQSTVYLLAYRGYGASEGKPGESALYSDALALYDHAALHHGSIDLIGRSLGSGVASHVAQQRTVERLALVTPFDSLAAVAQAHYPWLPVRWLMRDRYDSVAQLPDYTGQVLVVRAGRDRVIPAANTQRLIRSLGAPCRVLDLPDAGHNDIDRDPAYGRALGEFMRGEAMHDPQQENPSEAEISTLAKSAALVGAT
jgi:hypothetical protein